MNAVYRAISDPTRRRILALLRERDMAAGEIASRFEQSWPTISGHLAVLREADLVQADRAGTSITYRLNVTVLEEALVALLDVFRVGPAAAGAPDPTAAGVADGDPTTPHGSDR